MVNNMKDRKITICVKMLRFLVSYIHFAGISDSLFAEKETKS